MVKLSEDKRYLVDNSGLPFFWLGDTAWELIHRLKKEEITEYLHDRHTKGFNVIQTVILAELDGINTPNAYGQKPLRDNDPTIINEKYFELIDYFLDQTEQRGMLVGLLPTWGDKIVQKWGAGPLIFTPENAVMYGNILGDRYKDRPNIIWIIGGDRIPETPEQRAIFTGIATGIREKDAVHLMSYHPLGENTASDYFDEPWLDVDMFQSGHRNDCQEYRFVEACRKKETPRPIINGEARYENIGHHFWEQESDTWLDDYDVRVSAWWSMLAGAAGYTYGCNDIWQMYETGRPPIIQARTDWQEALHLPGSRHMGMMKTFFSHLPWQELVRDQQFVLNEENNDNEEYIMCAATEKRNLVVFYTPMGRPIHVNLEHMTSPTVTCWWFNPRSGRFQVIGETATNTQKTFRPWSHGRGSDFVLLLADSTMMLKI